MENLVIVGGVFSGLVFLLLGALFVVGTLYRLRWLPGWMLEELDDEWRIR